jgi:hypothetical protein
MRSDTVWVGLKPRLHTHCMCSEWTIRLGDAASDTSSIRCGYDDSDCAASRSSFASNVSACARACCDAGRLSRLPQLPGVTVTSKARCIALTIVKRQMYCCLAFNVYAAVFSLVATRGFRVNIVLREPCTNPRKSRFGIGADLVILTDFQAWKHRSASSLSPGRRDDRPKTLRAEHGVNKSHQESWADAFIRAILKALNQQKHGCSPLPFAPLTMVLGYSRVKS